MVVGVKVTGEERTLREDMVEDGGNGGGGGDAGSFARS